MVYIYTYIGLEKKPSVFQLPNVHNPKCNILICSFFSTFLIFLCTRRMMIEKLAAHIGDFTPRLQSNTRSIYQYCPIPLINFPQLDGELFVNIYYLRHLCDKDRFPDWPIREPVSSHDILSCLFRGFGYFL